MTISVELLLNVVLLLALAFLVVTWIWQWKSDNSYACRIARFLTHVALTAIEIGLLTVRLLNGESYGFQIFLSYLWLFNVVLSAFSLKND